jgi:S1-C subfamily serine protease
VQIPDLMTRTSPKPSKLRFLLPFLAGVLLWGCAPAVQPKEEPNPAAGIPEEGGFFEISDETMPIAVRNASQSVFRVLVPTTDSLQEVNTAFGAIYSLKMWVNVNEADPMLRSVLIAQVEYCAKEQGFFNSTEKKCRIANSFNRGSAFLMNDGKTLWTAAHLLDRAFSAKDIAPVFVIDKDGQPFFDPYTQPSQVTRPHPTSSDPHNDYARLDLPREIGSPLTLSPRAPRAGEPIYAIGFPTCTNCETTGKVYDRRERTTGPNATGKDQRISRGRPYALSNNPLIHTSVDVMPGNSGGPGLNQDGQVFGVAILAGSTVFRQNRHRLGVFVAPPSWRR